MENKDSLCKLDTTNRQIILQHDQFYNGQNNMEIKDTLCKLDYTTDNFMDSLGERKDNPSKTREH